MISSTGASRGQKSEVLIDRWVCGSQRVLNVLSLLYAPTKTTTYAVPVDVGGMVKYGKLFALRHLHGKANSGPIGVLYAGIQQGVDADTFLLVGKKSY